MDEMGQHCTSCGQNDQMIMIGTKMFSAKFLAEILAKHNRLLHKGVKPFLSLAQELDVPEDDLNSYLMSKNELLLLGNRCPNENSF